MSKSTQKLGVWCRPCGKVVTDPDHVHVAQPIRPRGRPADVLTERYQLRHTREQWARWNQQAIDEGYVAANNAILVGDFLRDKADGKPPRSKS